MTGRRELVPLGPSTVPVPCGPPTLLRTKGQAPHGLQTRGTVKGLENGVRLAKALGRRATTLTAIRGRLTNSGMGSRVLHGRHPDPSSPAMGTKCGAGAARLPTRPRVVELATRGPPTNREACNRLPLREGRELTRQAMDKKGEVGAARCQTQGRDVAVVVVLRHPLVAWRVPARTTERLRTRVELRRLLRTMVPRLGSCVGKRKWQISRRMVTLPLTSLHGISPVSDLFEPVMLKKVT
mmetsp:Transcript_753/g.2110  ORF Transcript_753/g.2110 Transcript_753/m.2110 type:complete len:239 (+) Transcript_753:574-1290(+)